MPLELSQFVKTRPYLYHLTARSNLKLIVASGRLRTAADLFAEAGENQLLRQRRRESRIVVCGGERVHVRDQAPLHAGNLKLGAKWTFEDFVEHLNGHVFFWPGTETGPIGYGKRHFERYAEEDHVVLVLKTDEMFSAQADSEPRFCRFNSGSPRCTGGQPSPRGPDTFVLARDFADTPSSVVEVTFRGSVSLPKGDLRTMAPKRFL